MTASPRIVRIADDVVFRDLSAGGGVLLHLVTGQYHRVNDTGAAICRLLDGTRDLDEVTTQVSAAHPGAGPQVADDVQEFVEAMTGRSLLTEATSGG